MPYSGQFADTATQMDNAIKLYMKQNGDTVAGKKIEIIRKDSGGIAPDVAKRLAQELITRDKVDIFGGLILTPNALAVGDVSAEAKKFTVIMNAATSIITTKSPYMARTSVTTPMLNQTLGTWAVKKGGAKKIYSMVSDFGPGHDAEGAFQLGVKEAGGEIVGSVRFPVANPDFSAFVQRAKDSNPDSIYIWIPGGTQPAAIGKAFAERGIDPKKTMILGQDVLADESALKSMGDISIGIVTAGALRLQPPIGEGQGIRQGVSRRLQALSGHLLDRRLRRHAPDLRDAEEDRRQGRRRFADRRRQGHEVGEPARPGRDRPGDARHHSDRLHPEGREDAGRLAQRRDRQGRERQGSGEGPDEIGAAARRQADERQHAKLTPAWSLRCSMQRHMQAMTFPGG